MKLAYFIITILYIVIAMRFGAMLVRTAAFARPKVKGVVYGVLFLFIVLCRLVCNLQHVYILNGFIFI